MPACCMRCMVWHTHLDIAVDDVVLVHVHHRCHHLLERLEHCPRVPVHVRVLEALQSRHEHPAHCHSGHAGLLGAQRHRACMHAAAQDNLLHAYARHPPALHLPCRPQVLSAQSPEGTLPAGPVMWVMLTRDGPSQAGCPCTRACRTAVRAHPVVHIAEQRLPHRAMRGQLHDDVDAVRQLPAVLGLRRALLLHRPTRGRACRRSSQAPKPSEGAHAALWSARTRALAAAPDSLCFPTLHGCQAYAWLSGSHHVR